MILRVLLIVSLIVPALPAAAEERFVIERLEIRNAGRVDPGVIETESLLREGSSVSEEDVRAAVRRLMRTPFVFTATYALEAGSDPERRVVVLSIIENTRFWFLGDGRFTQFHVPTDLIDYEYPDPSAEWKQAALGVRWMFGDGGLAHFGMTVLRNRLPISKNYSAHEIGYTRHGLFGTPFFATAIVRSPVDSLSEGTFTPEVVVGLPLNANHTLTARLEDTLFRRETVTFGASEFDRLHFERTVTAGWTYDTRNEPYAPMSGTHVRIEPGLWMLDFASVQSARPGQPPIGFASHNDAFLVEMVAEQHWRRSEVSSFSASIEAAWARHEDRRSANSSEDETWRSSYEVLRGGYARKIRGSAVMQFEGRVFLRQVSREDLRDDLGQDLTDTTYEAAAAWVQRRRWGTLRIGVTWVSDNSE